MKIVLALLMVLATGCATNKEYAAYLASHQALATQQAETAKAKYAAIAKGMEGGDPTSRAVAMMALAMAPSPQFAVAAPPPSEALQWVQAVMPTLGMLGMGYYNYQLGSAQSANQRDIAMSTNSAFVGMGNNIQQAGVAGYPFVQSPQPNQTFSGTGVWGAGAYTYNPTTNTWENSYNQTAPPAYAPVPAP